MPSATSSPSTPRSRVSSSGSSPRTSPAPARSRRPSGTVARRSTSSATPAPAPCRRPCDNPGVKRIAALLVLGLAIPAAAQKITTIAGDGTHGFSPDGSIAAASSIALALDSVANVVPDPEGNLVFSEGNASRVRRILKKTGALETLAGNGRASFAGDGGPATSAALKSPSEIAFDREGNLYIADAANYILRRVDAKTKIIATIAGIRKNRFTGDGPALETALARPGGITFDREGRLVIADTFNARIRRLDLATGRIETLAGNGDLLFFGPGPALQTGMAWVDAQRVDGAGGVFFCDTGNHHVLRLDTKTGRVEVAAGSGMNRYRGDGGPARAAEMNQPASLAIAAPGTASLAATHTPPTPRPAAPTGT